MIQQYKYHALEVRKVFPDNRWMVEKRKLGGFLYENIWVTWSIYLADLTDMYGVPHSTPPWSTLTFI